MGRAEASAVWGAQTVEDGVRVGAMTHRLFAAALGLILAMAPLHGEPSAQDGVAIDGVATDDGKAANGAQAWRTDLAAAIREATRERRPLLAVFR